MRDFKTAQIFELAYHEQYIKSMFRKEYDDWIKNKEIQKDGLDPIILSNMWEHNFFNQNIEQIKIFIDHIKDKNSLDVGSGSIPWTKDTWIVKKQYVIDPLVEYYKRIELEMFGVSFFDNMVIYSQPAEQKIEDLVGCIDGFIFCRNTIDHSDDHIKILENISEYAMSGSYFLFWSDIWHLNNGDDGHKCITKSKIEMDDLFERLNFRKIIQMNSIRNENYIDYGGVFIKK